MENIHQDDVDDNKAIRKQEKKFKKNGKIKKLEKYFKIGKKWKNFQIKNIATIIER